MRRTARFLLITIAIWTFWAFSMTWRQTGILTYEQAIWNGKTFVYTGKLITVCEWRCRLGL